MAFSTDSKYPNRRAYVVKLRNDACPGGLRGRVENLITCDQHEFDNAGELVTLLESDLQDSTSLPESDPKPGID